MSLRLSRRNFVRLSTTTILCVRTVVADSTQSKLKVVVAGGHPGDPEYGCGGTVARYADAGHHVTLLYLNHGEGGCGAKSNCASIRTPEAERACRILHAEPRFAEQVDGMAVVDGSHYETFRHLIAAEHPDVLFTHWPVDNHRDHRAMSMLCYDAWLQSKKSFGLYYYEVSNGEDTMMFSPTDYVDITGVEARKREACFAHASQSPERFYDLQLGITRFRGLESGSAQAEAFVRHAETKRNFLP
jgi:N-acetylglucosamine malate deacetylase 1